MSASRTDERWFISPLSDPEANRRVLAGKPIGASRLVRIFDTPEEAKEAVDAQNARLNAKGPAEAATSPSRGSNKASEETAVNDQESITSPVGLASYPNLDEPLAHLTMLTSLTTSLIDELFAAGNLAQEDGGSIYRVGSERLGQIAYLAHNAAVAARSIERRYDEAFVDALNTPVELDALISAHVHASRLLNMSMDVDEGINLGPNDKSALTLALKKDEVRTFEAILSWRPTTLAANALRMRYLDENPLNGIVPGEKDWTLLLNSLVSAVEA